jgi:hypothetical protein
VPLAGDAVRVAPGGFWRPWYWGAAGGRLIAFNVGNALAPQFLSDLNLASNTWWNFSPAFPVNGLVFLSHETSEFLEGVVPPSYVPPIPSITFDPTTGEYVTNEPPVGTWVQRHYLDVVDYADPLTPTLRPPVNLPGALRGLARGGELLYTVGAHFDLAKWETDGTEWLEASAYDSVEVHLIDSLALSRTWPHPVLPSGDYVWVGRPAESSIVTDSLETWTLSGAGFFTRVGATQLASAAQALAGFGSLLAVQTSDRVNLYNASNPASLGFVGTGKFSSCAWFDLAGADGALDRGLWIPLSDFGVAKIEAAAGLR